MFYCDTSALMKLYVQEEHSETMRQVCARSDTVFVSDMTWVEMRSALALRVRTNQTSRADAELALAKLRLEWPSYQALALDESVFEAAGNHTEAFELRAYDSVQLACAQRLNISLSGQMTFCCFDKQLNTAARVLGMRVLDL